MLTLRESVRVCTVDALFVFHGPFPSAEDPSLTGLGPFPSSEDPSLTGLGPSFGPVIAWHLSSITFLGHLEDRVPKRQSHIRDKMILTIPHQAFEIGNIHVTPFQIDRFGKTIARLTYKDNSLDFQDVSILSPPMRILDYNPETSRLRLDLSEHPHFHHKMNTLHDYLISTFYTHQQSFLNQQGQPYEAIRRLFYFLLDGFALSLFIYPTVVVKGNPLRMGSVHGAASSASSTSSAPLRVADLNGASFAHTGNSAPLRVADLKPGDRIRCVIRLQGVSQLLNRNELRLRLHHSVPALWSIHT